MNRLWTLLVRELRLGLRGSFEMIQPVLFCLLVVSLFPLGIGPSPTTLNMIAPGVIWVAAILSSLLGMEKLFREDFEDGSLEQMALTPFSLSSIVLIKIFAHWLMVIMPLVVISPLMALFLNMDWHTYQALVLTLLLGTPVMSLVGAIAVALTLSINKGGVLLALLMLPIFVPLLIFATSAVNNASLQLNYIGQLGIIGAMFLFALVTAPFAVSYAIKVSQN